MIDSEGIVKTSEVTKQLGVTEMTVRRDLKALEERGLLMRIHGGAKRKSEILVAELSHVEKKQLNIDEKKYVAKQAAALVSENDSVFIGHGTTNEFIYDYLNVPYARIITNSLPVFTKFKGDERFELLLVGGRLRARSDVFIGSFTNHLLEKISVKIAFIGTNGIYGHQVTNYNEEEGTSQKIILDNASERYILCDSSKLDKQDFFSFYRLEDVTAMITDNKLEAKVKERYERIVKVIN